MKAPFNTPLEAGLRTLFLLSAAGNRGYDTQSLVYLDYLLVHSGDLDGPPSLHPESPGKKGELLVRRQLVQAGLNLMRSRELVEQRFSSRGIQYAATRAGAHVAKQFESDYAASMRERAGWVIERFGRMQDKALADTLRPFAQLGEDELIAEGRPDWSLNDV